MCGIDEKIAGYEYNDFQFWEIQNVHDMKLGDAIINGQISKKNFKNEMFRSCADEYDKTVNSFLSQTGRGDCFDVFALLALFTLVWKYALISIMKLQQKWNPIKLHRFLICKKDAHCSVDRLYCFLALISSTRY